MRKGLISILFTLFLFSLAAGTEKKGEQKTMSGTLSCIFCDLKQSSGAHAQCKIYGHDFALKLDDGSYISFLENDHSILLINANKNQWKGQKASVTGIYYPDVHLIDVQKFELMGEEYSWCDIHKTMDQCHTGMDH